MMLADWLLSNIFGENPIQFSDNEDKWIAILAKIIFYGIPLTIIFLFIAPFIYLLIKKINFSLKNISIALLVSIILVLIGLGGIWLLFFYLQGVAFKGIYGID